MRGFTGRIRRLGTNARLGSFFRSTRRPLTRTRLATLRGKTEATLERRAEPYTIFVSTYAPGEEASFVLAVYSDRPVGLAPIDPEAVGVDV